MGGSGALEATQNLSDLFASFDIRKMAFIFNIDEPINKFNGFLFQFCEQSFSADQSNCHQSEQCTRSLKSWRSVVFINFHTWQDGGRVAGEGACGRTNRIHEFGN